MATQVIEFVAATGQSLTIKLFAAESDTVVATATATEETNRRGVYLASVTDVAAGLYQVIGFVGAQSVAVWDVELELAAGTYRAAGIGDTTPAAATSATVVWPSSSATTADLPDDYAGVLADDRFNIEWQEGTKRGRTISPADMAALMKLKRESDAINSRAASGGITSQIVD